jgi:hypothetical protein
MGLGGEAVACVAGRVRTGLRRGRRGREARAWATDRGPAGRREGVRVRASCLSAELNDGAGAGRAGRRFVTCRSAAALWPPVRASRC